IGQEDCVALTLNPAFVLSTFDLSLAFLNGARVVFIDEDTRLNPIRLAEALVRYRVTYMFITAPLLVQYAHIIGKTLSNLRYLVSGGEQVQIKAFSAVQQHGGRVRLINRYGSTEMTSGAVYTATHTVSRLDRLPIGRPSSNRRAYVLDQYLKPVPIGAVGDLYIGGPGLATEYLNHPVLTAEKFLPDPFSGTQGARMYKSGDLARYLSDGNLVCAGRSDDLVKIRGFRVELGEIQNRLVRHSLVRNAVIVVAEQESEKRLVAYVEADHHHNLAASLREYLAHMLPDYMIPAAFVRMDVLPLTSRGKVDRRALPEPDFSPSTARDYIEPQGDIEIALAEMWSELLKIARISRHDDFFKLGGHSIMAMRLLNAVATTFGPQLPMSVFFASPTLQGLAETVTTNLTQRGTTAMVIPHISRDSLQELSFPQQRLWVIVKISPATDNYHIHQALRLRGALDYVALQKAMETVYARHDALRSVFPTVDGEAKVRILPSNAGVPFTTLDLRQEPDCESVASQASIQEVRAPFDIELGPLIRVKLIQLQEDEHILIITMHHIITDGWSMARQNLAGAPVLIDLPTDRPRPILQSFAGDIIPIHLDSKLTHDLKTLSEKHGVTLFMTVLAAWVAVLSRLSGQDDIVIGTPSANRGHQQVENLIGFFVSTLALRVDLSAQPNTKQLLERVRKTTVSAQAHQDLPFEQVVEVVRPPRRTDITPIFQVMLAWQNNDYEILALNDLDTSVEDIKHNVLKFDLDLELSEKNGAIIGCLNYATALFDHETIVRHVGYLEAMLRWMVADGAESIDTAPIVSSSECDMLLQTWNNTDAPYPDDQCIHSLFENQVEKSPEAVAIAHDERSLTYRELNSQANWIAQQLIDKGVKPGDYVMLLFDRSIDLVASQIAVLKVGAAYVPIDTNSPLERQMFIATHCESTMLITDETKVVSEEFQATVIRLSGTHCSIEQVQDNFEFSAGSSRDTAYVMYTSGSTGRPKGVMVHHRGIARLVVNNGFADMCSTDRMAFSTTPAFDPSTYQVWAPLLHGASIVIISTDTFKDPMLLADALARHRINCLYMTNDVFHQYAFIIGKYLSKLKYLHLGAEQGQIEAYTAVLQHYGGVHLVNEYGPTETTVNATSYKVTSRVDGVGRLPIGKPISNTRLYVLDNHLEPLPLGAIGELYIGGPGVANGYLNQPELTAQRFIPDPFTKVQGARMYKTGDLVRYLPDGNLVFLGRNDNQVKIRGFRIELGEIESRLAEHRLVRETVVLAVGEGSDDKRLVAYFVAEHHDNLTQTLRQHLAEILPEYMVPSAFVRMDAFPLTNNGKIDRRALPDPTTDSLLTVDYVSPQGEMEVAIAAIWSDLLKVERIGRHDNFFMLGGHSLLAVRLMNRLSAIGVHLSLSTLFSSPTLAALAGSVGSDAVETKATHSAIHPTTRDGPLELSFAQQRMWFLTQLDGLSEIYHVPFAARLHGPLNCDAFKKTLDTLFARHESLRSVFVAIDGQPQVRLLSADIGFPLGIQDVRDECDKERRVNELALQHVSAPFDLATGPLVRATLIQLAEMEHVFLLTMHHIVTDGWSMTVMIRELNALYEVHCTGKPDPLPSLSIQYPDYAAWQRQQLTQEKLQDQVEYWKENLADAPVCIELPTDRPRPPHQSFVGASVPIHFDSKLTYDLKTLSEKHGVTMFMTVLAAWSAVLSRLSGQDDIIIGTPSANRGHQQVENLIGFFVSTLALRIDLSAEPNTKQLLERVRQTTISAQAHQDLPFEQVVEVVRPPRRTDITPIFQVMLAWQNDDVDELKLHNIESVYERQQYDVVKFELDLSLGEKSGAIVGCLDYATALFNNETIARHVGYLEAMLRWMVSDGAESIGVAPIVSSSERDMLLHAWNNTDAPYPDDQCIHSLFENQVEKSPEAVAIVHDHRSLTYRELNSRSNWIAQQLINTGVMPGDYVMLLFDRSIDLVASQIAVLKVGAVYVPIDTNSPLERQAFIAADCGSSVLITDETKAVPQEFQGTVSRLSATHCRSEFVQDNFKWFTGSSRDTAYVMYTSGSTGRPKGVMVHHQGIARLVVNNGYTEISSDDCVGFMINPSFDPSTFEVWSALLHGARLAIIDKETVLDSCLLEALILRQKVSVLFMASAVLHRHVFSIGHTLSHLKYLLAGGEQALLDAYVTMARIGGPCTVINTYGPTEATVTATSHTDTVAVDRTEPIPIGRAAGNTRVYVLDYNLAPVPIGAVGELYIGGPGVANGYLNQPELTAQRFIPDPFSKVQGARMYRTGDLVRYLPDGNLVFLGRNDNQVKIRGFRIELGEIESRLAEHRLVREAVVLAVGEGSDDKRLVAYVAAEHHDDLNQTLRQHLTAALPEYMVPTAFVRMDAFPLTNNGKIDRRALPEPTSDTTSCSRDYEEPQGETEVMLAAIWVDLLRVDRVSRHDNFFMLGGHSLMAVRMIEKLRQLGYSSSVRLLFDKPLLHVFAACLHQGHVESVVPPNLITPASSQLTPNMLPLIDLNQDDIDTIVDQVPGGVANIQDIYALSPLQDGILFHHMKETVGDTYLLVLCTRFRDRDLLDRYLGAFQKVIDRHDSLRTVFIWENLSTSAQVVLRDATLSVVEHALDPADGPIADQLMQMYNPRKYRIALNEAPLMRFAYAQDADGRLIVIQLHHHLISDHSTMDVIQEEIEAIVDGQIKSLPTPQPYRNLIAQVRQGPSAEEHKQFFKEMLHDIDSPSLPFGLSDVHGDGTNVSDFHCMLPQDLNDKLRSHARRLGVSLASLCHLAWAQVVAATSGQSKVVFGSVLFGRMQGGEGSDRALGLHINTLPMRIDIQKTSVLDSVLKVHADLAGLLEHEHASLAVANRCSGVPSGTPLFSSMLNYRHNTFASPTTQENLGADLIFGQERTNYPVSMSVDDNGSSLGLTADIMRPYESSRLCRYMEQALINLARSLEQSPSAAVQSLCVLPAEEYEMVVHAWNNTDVPYPDDQCIHTLFENQVEKSPEAIAIVHDERSLTYRELDFRANWIARKLINTGVMPGDYVMLLFDRSIDLVASQIAVLKVGAAYVPIDTNSPLERQAFIAADCGSSVLITDETKAVPQDFRGTVIRLSMVHSSADFVQGMLKWSGITVGALVMPQ
ncbi:hypothetical protein BG004_004928, partial [Podila humilis]